MTSNRAYKLRFDMEDWDGNTRYAEYATFRVTSEADNYRLLLGSYSGTASIDQAADKDLGLLYHNNTQFSTYDRDNDLASFECVYQSVCGGFWYNDCHRVTPTNRRCTAARPTGCYDWCDGLIWYAWHGEEYSLKAMKMMFRPA